MGHIKHWGRRYDAVEEHICAEAGCMNAAVEFDRGRPKCVRHLTLRMEATRERYGMGMDAHRHPR